MQPLNPKRDPKNGCLIGPSTCHYSNLHQIFHYDILKLCGCGLPEEAYNFCLEVLKVFDRRDRDNSLKEEWVWAEPIIAELIKSKPETAAHVLAHIFTHFDLLEHGGSVGGSWLTPLGEQMVDLGPITEEKMGEN